jgi:hypothetical protein
LQRADAASILRLFQRKRVVRQMAIIQSIARALSILAAALLAGCTSGPSEIPPQARQASPVIWAEATYPLEKQAKLPTGYGGIVVAVESDWGKDRFVSWYLAFLTNGGREYGICSDPTVRLNREQNIILFDKAPAEADWPRGKNGYCVIPLLAGSYALDQVKWYEKRQNRWTQGRIAESRLAFELHPGELFFMGRWNCKPVGGRSYHVTNDGDEKEFAKAKADLQTQYPEVLNGANGKILGAP